MENWQLGRAQAARDSSAPVLFEALGELKLWLSGNTQQGISQ
jgi:hypothetical protein